jgi:tetratricopeptide (TPR) repeat protein
VGRILSLVSFTSVLFSNSSLAVLGCRLEEAQALIASRKTAEARRVLEPCAREDPRDAQAASALARAYLLEQDIDQAVFWFERAVELEPGNSDFRLWLGRACGQKALRANVLEQFALARRVRRSFEQAVKLDPSNLSARLSLLEYYVRAPGILGGSLEKARSQAGEIRNRDRLRGHRAFGQIAEEQKSFTAAAREYDEALREFPQSSDPVYWRADLAMRQKDYAMALELLESLWRARSEPEALYRIGRLAVLSGQGLERGEECLKLYIDHQPTEDEPSLASAHLELGALYQKQGDRARARKEYEAALTLEPSSLEAKKALSRN